jgi:predicted component of type VI protein secretion system
MKFSLRVLTPGKQEGQVLEIKLSQFLVGRDPQCHLRPASPLISKRHCALIQRDGKAFIRDFDSTNGTLVNDEPITGESELRHGDRLKIGPILFAVQLEAGAPGQQKTPAPPTKGAAAPAAKAPGKPAAPATKTPPPPTKAAPPTATRPAVKPAPAPAASGSDEDDIAAMLMSMADDSQPGNSTGLVASDIPDGSTVMEVPLQSEVAAPAAKAGKDEKKDKAKAATGNTSSAAASILEKMMKRPRT